ncbi:hypothetical protein P3T76_003359 [Phytophthora citrophthora]|uniref:Uncharacterized protein n=1 Tax=Phytophthora citrophthora TaxID=4793 RepID=A0AAD9LQM1_9STRA|nr:hypothetical protein P3T76_003359 [Phytophthora citrophthora]
MDYESLISHTILELGTWLGPCNASRHDTLSGRVHELTWILYARVANEANEANVVESTSVFNS